MNEKRAQRPLPRKRFLRRLAIHFASVVAFVLVSLFLGIAGFEHFENLGALDAFLNASMLLGGLGPVDVPRTDGGKLFAGFYALYSGLVFLVAAGVLLIPVFHWVLHRFHWEEGGDDR